MKITLKLTLFISCIALITACGGGGGGKPKPNQRFASIEALGKSLFNDVNLSKNRTQSCATCHDPEHAFIDARLDPKAALISTLSLGDDGKTLGLRNAPTATYRKFSPSFHIGTRKRLNSKQPDYKGVIGGQFYDGRAKDLSAQAGEPPLGASEMNMSSKGSVIERLRENSDYVDAFNHFFGEGILNNTDKAYLKMTEAIAKFEETAVFSTFDSKYDRFLQDPTVFSLKEAYGKSLFFSQQFTNCATCHQLKANSNPEETFSSYEYHNIGVPQFGKADAGLFDNTQKAADKGKFKVPTLRNIAVTEPYMHNGVFRELKTVIQFYDQFLVNSIHTINPETGKSWREPEFPDTVNLTELKDGRKMGVEEIEAMVCFLRTLTDKKYEPLIKEKGISCVD